jgi:hypothetical protein
MRPASRPSQIWGVWRRIPLRLLLAAQPQLLTPLPQAGPSGRAESVESSTRLCHGQEEGV